MRVAGRAGVIANVAIMGLALALSACGGEKQDAVALLAAPSEPAPIAETPKDPKVAEGGNIAATDPAAVKPAEVAPKPADPVAPPTDPGTPGGEAPTGAEGKPVTVDGAGEPNPSRGWSYPSRNTIVRDPEPDTPAGVIMLALTAAMNPDANKGWGQFQALLHTSELLPNALISRRELNWPAMRRKVHLFLIEDPTKPIYQWSYAEETADGQLKIFVHNPKSMPTPCYVAQDPEQDNKWRIRTCSL